MKQSLSSVLSQTEDTITRYILAIQAEVNPSDSYETCLNLIVPELQLDIQKKQSLIL